MLYLKKDAIFSEDEDRMYRYLLTRVWDSSKPVIGFIGLNPSCADACIDDKTSLKLTTLSDSWGYGGFHISNLFAYRSTDSNALKNVSNPIGEKNNKYIMELINICEEVVLMWGNKGNLLNRNNEVLSLLNPNNTYCIRMTKSGNPSHPLFLKGDSPKIKYIFPEKIK